MAKEIMKRRVVTYPSPMLHNLFEAFTKANQMNKSDAAEFIFRDFFKRMTPEEKKRITILSNNVSKNSY